tara:strand:+ start:789 stop:1616 length:828 start_codon:yes stop_codon:yes gene_type:complete
LNKIAVFGDVHGRADMLKLLHKKIKDYGDDIELFSCGDLIDRGDNSAGVIDYCVKNDIKAVIGNHDEWLIRLCVEFQFDPYSMQKVMGGKATAVSYGAMLANKFQKGVSNADIAEEIFRSVPKPHKDWMAKLPFYRRLTLETGEVYWILHAGLTETGAASYRKEGDSDEDMLQNLLKTERGKDMLIWSRPNYPKTNEAARGIRRSGSEGKSDNLYSFDDGIQIFGHTIRPEAIVRKHFIALDTGCGTRNPSILTAVILPEQVIITVHENELKDGA